MIERLRLTVGSLLPALALIPLFALPALAQEGGTDDPPADRRFEDRTRVLEVQVPINIYTKAGEAVAGLTAADFKIVDDGRPQEITAFQEVNLTEITAGDDELFDADNAIPAIARRHFLFLFDLSFSSNSAVVRAREAARDFVLTSMHPTDLAAVAWHTVENGPRMVMSFSPDRAQLARAIDTLGNPRLLQLAKGDPLRLIIDTPTIDGGISSLDVGGVNSDVDQIRQATSDYLRIIGHQMAKVEKSYARGRISSWSRSMGEMARILGAVEGRKHIIFFTEGFDGRLLLGREPEAEDQDQEDEYLSTSIGNYYMIDSDDRFGNTQLQGEMLQMIQEFRSSDSIIQAVDISGLRADHAEESRQRAVNDDSLFYLANETGGQVYEDANNFGFQLGKVMESTSVTYLLSFRPDQIKGPGEHHKLKVSARAPKGSKVSHRAGYYEPKPFVEMHPLEKSLLAADLIASAVPQNDLEMKSLAVAFKASDDRAYVPVIIEIAGASLLAGHKDFSRVPVELYTYVTDSKGEMKDFFTQLVTISLETRKERFAETGLKYYGALFLDPGEYLIRVLARNGETGATGVKTIELDIPNYADREATLLPPFFMEELGKWFLVRQETENPQSTRIYPFTVNGEPYVPSAHPGLALEEEAELCLVAYHFGEGELELESTILDADGEAVATDVVSIAERTVTGIEGVDKLIATFRSGELEAGDYRLEIALANPANQRKQRSSIPFSVNQR